MAGCDESDSDLATPQYSATVVKTEFGIPHITADSWDHSALVRRIPQLKISSKYGACAGSIPGQRRCPGPGKNQNASRDIVVKALAISEKAQRAKPASASDRGG